MVRLSSTTSFWISLFRSRTFRGWDLVGDFGLVHRRAILLILVGLSNAADRNKEVTGLIDCFPEGLLGLFGISCFASFSKVFVAGFSITCPVRLHEVDVRRSPLIVDSSELMAMRMGR